MPAPRICRPRPIPLRLLAVGGLLVAAGCGRPAPESAAGVDSGVEPAVAGIEVVSADPVITPPPTTAETVTTTATTVAPQPAGSYVVESGDTLSRIAAQFGVTVEALSQANGITDVNSIRPGQELIIPAG